MKTSMEIAYFKGQIDPTHFGLVRNYLASPNSSIHHVLHVKDPAMLPRLAAALDGALNSPVARLALVHKTIEPLIEKGTLKISSFDVQSSIPGSIIDPASIPRSAPCHVLYLPPFYLVHTPGLFEGKFQADKSQGQSVVPPKTHEESQAQVPAQELVRKQSKDHGMSH